jgi:2'-5' RNA ligase
VARIGDFILVHFLDKQPVGGQFLRHRNDWPLHITLVPWFTADEELTRTQIAEMGLRLKPCVATFADVVDFNPQTRVTLMHSDGGINTLHERLLEVILRIGGQLRVLEWIGSNYRPHVTHHGNAPIPTSGQLLSMDQFSLVRLVPTNICEVMDHIPIGAYA